MRETEWLHDLKKKFYSVVVLLSPGNDSLIVPCLPPFIYFNSNIFVVVFAYMLSSQFDF